MAIVGQRCAGVVLIPLLLWIAAAWAGAPPSVTEQTIRQRQTELEELKTRIEERKARIAQLRAEGEDLERLLAELERQRSVTSQYIAKLDAQVEALENDLAYRRTLLARREAELGRARVELGQSLVHYYKRGRLEAAELLLSSDSFGAIFARSHYWVRTIGRLRDRIDEVHAQSREIEAGLEATHRRRESVLALRRERDEQLRSLEAQERQRQQDRARLQEAIARYQEQTEKLLASQQEIERLILEAQRATGGVPGAGLAELQGILPWPIAGSVVAQFGTHVHPRYGTRVRRKGIQISAAEGTPVAAVAGGQVVYVGWLEGYGNTVVVDHGQSYFTLYAHASQVLVSAGDRVAAGQAIARAGSTDSLYGSGLHFEIREGKDARDPARWLRPR